jgi:hypothetical protein
MSDLIDKNVVTKNLKDWLEQTGAILQGTSYYGELFGCIEDAPTVDAVPVVRCKDCKYYMPMATIEISETDSLPYVTNHFAECKSLNCVVNSENFCCWGDRRTDKNENH